MNGYLAQFSHYFLELAKEIGQVPDYNGVVKRSAGKLLPEVAKSIEHFVLNALPPLLEDSLASTSVSLDKNHYSLSHPHNTEGYKYNIHIERAFKKLADAGYIVITTRGWQDRSTGNSDNTKYRLTPKFRSWFLIRLTEVGFTGDLETLIVDPAFLPAPALLRVQRRKRSDISNLEPRTEKVSFPITRLSQQIWREIEILNNRLAHTWIDLDLTNNQWKELNQHLSSHKKKDRPRFIRFNERQLYRVFHDTSFTTGGRYYGGWWQTIPKQYRKHIVINGKATAEVDYSGLHPSILYATEGLPLPDDPYTPILGRKYRGLAKKIFNSLINATRDPKSPPRGMKIIFPDQQLSWEQIKQRVYELHQPIKHFFCTGSGLWLMHEDSVLATKILHNFASTGIPCLPVHDSFLVHHGYQNALLDEMGKFFQERYGLMPNLKTTDAFFHRSGSSNPVTDDLTVLLEELDTPQENRLSAFRALQATHAKSVQKHQKSPAGSHA